MDYTITTENIGWNAPKKDKTSCDQSWDSVEDDGAHWANGFLMPLVLGVRLTMAPQDGPSKYETLTHCWVNVDSLYMYTVLELG